MSKSSAWDTDALKVVANVSFEAIQRLGLLEEDGIVCHIFAPWKRVFSIPYPAVFGFGAKIFLPLGIWSIFLHKDLIHENLDWDSFEF